MKTFTKIEVAWMLDAIKLAADYYSTHSKDCGGVEAQMAALRSEQLTTVAEKLSETLETGSKRIAIKY